MIDGFLPKLEELVERSKGKVRADVAHEKITAMGFAGSERTTRRAVARLKEAWQVGAAQGVPAVGPRAGHVGAVRLRRRPGGRRGGDGAVLPVAGLVPVPGGGPAAGQGPGIGLGGVRRGVPPARRVPAYLLTDNEKTVTVEHVAGIPVRNRGAVEFGRHYGLTVATCVPYDPASKGGSESTVKLAKADLVPTDANLLAEYGSFAAWRRRARVLRAGQRPAAPGHPPGPGGDARRGAARLHPVPARAVHRGAGRDPAGRHDVAGAFEGGQYSVPHELAGQVVHVRRHGEQVVMAHAGPGRRWHGTGSPRRAARALTTRTTTPLLPGR